jgi:hypothetical protein
VVIQALLGTVERGGHEEDREIMLVRHRAADRERVPVPDVLHPIADRHARVPGPDEVSVQRVHRPPGVDRTPGGHQGLPGHLAAEYPLRADRRALPDELVSLDRGQVQQLQELVDGRLPDDHLR